MSCCFSVHKNRLKQLSGTELGHDATLPCVSAIITGRKWTPLEH